MEELQNLASTTFTTINQQNAVIADNKKSIAVLTKYILELEGRLVQLENYIDQAITEDIKKIMDENFKDLEDKIGLQNKSIQKSMSRSVANMYTGGKMKTRKNK